MATRVPSRSMEELLAEAGWLRGLARALVGPAAADDLVQDTLVAAMAAPPAADRPARPWLMAVLRNRARMRARTESRRAARERRAGETAAAGQTAAGAAADHLHKLETQRILCEVVAALAEPYRSTILLRYFEGLEPAEIAQRAGIPAGTVRWRHQKALSLVREALDRRSDGDRSTWLAALAPLARFPARTGAGGAGGAGAAAGSAAVRGALLMNAATKISIAVVAIALAATAMLWHRRPAAPPAPAPAPAAHAAATPVRLTLRESRRAGAPPDAAPAVPIGRFANDADARVTGVVRDGGGGFVPDPVVTARDLRGHAYAARGDARGRYALPLPHGDYHLTARGDGYAAATRYAEVSGTTELDFYLNPAAAITGRVTIAGTGDPAAGAKVIADGDGEPPRAATADASGRFRIAGLPPNSYDVTASLGDRAAAARVALHLGDEHTVDLALAKIGGSISGQVVAAADRHPIAGAKIVIDGRVHRDAVTGKDGRFRSGGLLPDTYTVSVTAGRFVRASRRVIVAAGAAPAVTIALREGGTVRGQVTAADGTPVSGAIVRSSAWMLRDPRLEDVRTDTGGRFTLAPLPPGRTTVSAYDPGRGLTDIADVEVPAGGTIEVDLHFGASASIAGTVRYDDGAPAAGARIGITGVAANASWTTAADAQGRFAVKSLPADRYDVTAKAAGAVSQWAVRAVDSSARVDLDKGEQATVDLKVPGGSASIRGRVVDASGDPVAGAGVWAERVAELIDMGAGPGDVRVYSRDDGTFELTRLPRGNYTVYARGTDGAVARTGPVAAGATGVTIALATPATIVATVVRADGNPATDVRLTWSWATRELAHHGFASERASRVLSNPGGRFTIHDVQPSDKVWVRAATPDGERGGTAKPFPLHAGQSKQLEIQLREPGTVRGRLIDAATGKPLVGVMVEIRHARAPVYDDGRFEAKVPAGHYDSLFISRRPKRIPPEVKRPFDVSAGKVTDLGDLRLSGK